MPTQTAEDLREFHRFLSDKVSDSSPELSPEEALDEWRKVHPETDAMAENVGAIQESLDDIANGDRGIPFAEFDREFQQRHKFSA